MEPACYCTLHVGEWQGEVLLTLQPTVTAPSSLFLEPVTLGAVPLPVAHLTVVFRCLCHRKCTENRKTLLTHRSWILQSLEELQLLVLMWPCVTVHALLSELVHLKGQVCRGPLI